MHVFPPTTPVTVDLVNICLDAVLLETRKAVVEYAMINYDKNDERMAITEAWVVNMAHHPQMTLTEAKSGELHQSKLPLC